MPKTKTKAPYRKTYNPQTHKAIKDSLTLKPTLKIRKGNKSYIINPNETNINQRDDEDEDEDEDEDKDTKLFKKTQVPNIVKPQIQSKLFYDKKQNVNKFYNTYSTPKNKSTNIIETFDTTGKTETDSNIFTIKLKSILDSSQNINADLLNLFKIYIKHI